MAGKETRFDLIPPDEYQELLPSVTFDQMYYKSGKWYVKQEVLGDENDLEVGFETDIVQKDSKKAVYVQHFFLRVIPKGKKRSAISIDCDVVTECVSHIEQSGKFWNTYKEITLPIITVPFFREYVYNLSGKMGIPPILIPPWRR